MGTGCGTLAQGVPAAPLTQCLTPVDTGVEELSGPAHSIPLLARSGREEPAGPERERFSHIPLLD